MRMKCVYLYSRKWHIIVKTFWRNISKGSNIESRRISRPIFD